MTVYLVGAGPGDPGLLTRRGAELLERADVVLYDRLVSAPVLALVRPGARLVDVGKRTKEPHRLAAEGTDETEQHAGEPCVPSARSGVVRTEQERINEELVSYGRRWPTVVRLKGGDPYLFGRGGEEAEVLRQAGVDWEVVPGVTSAFAVPAYAGVPVSHRGRTSAVTVVTGHSTDPDDPAAVDWEKLAGAGGTLVIVMGMAHREQISRRLQAGGLPATTPVAIVERGTTPAERVERTTLSELGSVALGPPAVIVVGEVAALDLDWTTGRALHGVSVVITRSRDQSGPLAAALAELGAGVLCVPVIEIADPPDGGAAVATAALRASDFDWVAFTSANAVHRFIARLGDVRDLGRTRLAAVGEATAAALAEHHLVADLVAGPAAGLAAGLAADSAPVAPAGAGRLATVFPPPSGSGRVLFPSAAGARPELPAGLRAKGWEVTEVVAYETVPAPPLPRPLAAALAGADVVVFTSPSTVSAYLAHRDAGGEPLAVPPLSVCIGPVTAAAAERAGLVVAGVARSASVSALVEAVVSATARPTTARPTTARPTTARPATARPTTARPTTARPTTA